LAEARSPTVWAFPRAGFYGDCLYAPMEAAGVMVHEGEFSAAGLARIGAGDCVHLHWPSHLYAVGPSKLDYARHYAAFEWKLRRLHARGARIFWTAHNLYPHERTPLPSVDRRARDLVIGMAEAIFVHGPSAEAVLCSEFPAARGKCVRIELGGFADYYANDLSRAEARAQLGLPEGEFAYLFLGQWRPYKNLPLLIETFARLPEPATLLLVGNAPARLASEVQALAQRVGGGRVRAHPGRVPDEELQVWCKAADAMVLPYREILSSGAAVLAMSFGCPVIAPRRGHLRDLIDETNGVGYEPEDPLGLERAMTDAIEREFDRQAIARFASAAAWARTAALTSAAYHAPGSGALSWPLQ
jgi:glycosyltransferase involved in cell wall biosynthesis